MFEKVNPSHPDKIADRIAGAIVDMAYAKEENPKVAVEVLIGHGECTVITEASVAFSGDEVAATVRRIAGGEIKTNSHQIPQDIRLAGNQRGKIRCGDNGIFCGMPVSEEQHLLSCAVREIYQKYPFDGKYILSGDNFIACQSNVTSDELEDITRGFSFAKKMTCNPLGYWTGGTDVDTGATNRKLGSDMGNAVTGGGLHGKDLSKADVSVNIYAHIKAQKTGRPVRLFCAIGDEYVDGVPYCDVVEIARAYIKEVGGFEKFAEWGLI